MDRSAAGSPIPSSSGMGRPPPVIPPQPEVKRSRGRPRKQPLDECTIFFFECFLWILFTEIQFFLAGKPQKEKVIKVEEIIDVVDVGAPMPLPPASIPMTMQTTGYEYLKQGNGNWVKFCTLFRGGNWIKFCTLLGVETGSSFVHFWEWKLGKLLYFFFYSIISFRLAIFN
jgi:hypothetical protein